MRQVSVRGRIRLDQFLKWAGAVSTGGQGKVLIKSGMVRVNGEIIFNRGRILNPGDMVNVDGFGDFMVAGGEGDNLPPGPGEK